MKRRLTQKQENFVLCLFKGLSQREAYLKAGYSPKQSPGTLSRNAYELAKTNYILTRLSDLRTEAKKASMIEDAEKRQILAKIARDQYPLVVTRKEALVLAGRRTDDDVITTIISNRDPVKAIAELNKMDGVYATAPIEFNDNRQYNLILHSEKTKKQLEEIADGHLSS